MSFTFNKTIDMRTIAILIFSLLISFILTSCGSSNKGVSCYAFTKSKNQSPPVAKFGFNNKKFNKKKGNSKNGRHKSLRDEEELNYENAVVLNTLKEPQLLKPKDDFLYPSTETTIPSFSKDHSAFKKQKKRKKKQSKSISKPTPNYVSITPFNKRESIPRKLTLSKNKEGLFLLYASLMGVFIAGLFRFNQSKFMNISRWGKKNSKKAIAAITAMKVFLIFSGLFVGKHLAENDLTFSDPVRNILLGSYLAAALFYPSKHDLFGFSKQSYFRQKIHDLSLVLSGFFIMVCLGNKSAVDTNFSAPTSFVFQTYDNHFSDTDDHLTTLNTENSKEKSANSYKKTELSNGAKAGFTILAILVFLVLLYLIAGLACSLSCNGQDALAAIVGIGGASGLIVGLIFVLKSIYKKD